MNAPRTFVFTLTALAACGGSGGGGGQDHAPSAALLDGYPFVASKAVAIDDTGTVFDGAGGGVFLLEHALAGAPLSLLPEEKVATPGMVLDLAATDDFLYAATWRNGLVAIPRSDYVIAHPQPLAGTEGAWSVAVLDADAATCPGRRILVVGTQEPEGSQPPPAPTDGRLLIVEHDLATGELAVRGQLAIGAPVRAVAASAAIAPPPANGWDASFSVLVGADCARLASQAAWIQRRDFSYRCGANGLEIRQDGAVLSSEIAGEPAKIVRDIAIDESSARAYVAAYFDGVLAFDVPPGALARDASPGWPIAMNDALGLARRGHATVVALDPAPELEVGKGPRLFVGWGASFAGEWQYFGDSSRPECAVAPPASSPTAVSGVWSYRLDASADPEVGANGVVEEFALDPPDPHGLGNVAALAVRRIDPALYFLYCAGDGSGLVCARVEQNGQTWTPSIEAAWNDAPPANVPLVAHNDALVLEDLAGARHLFVATEHGLVSFALAASSLEDVHCAPFAPVPCADNSDAVLLAGFPAPNARVYASTVQGAINAPGGVRVYDVSSPAAPLALGPQLDKGGRGFGIAAVPGLYSGPPPADADRPRWLLTTQSQSLARDESWRVMLWDMGTQAAPSDPGCTQPCSPPALLAAWEDAVDTDAIEGIAVLETIAGRELAVYVPYAINTESPASLAAARAGVVVLRVTLDALGTPAIVRAQKTVAFQGIDTTFVAGRATLDVAGSRLYACWGTGGLALYDVSSPFAIQELGVRDLSSAHGDYNQRLSPTQIMPGPTQCGGRWIYVATVNDGIGVLDAEQGLSGPITWFPVRSHAFSLVVDPADPSRETLFVLGGRGGVDRMRIDLCP